MGLLTTLLDGLRGGPRADADPNDERYWMPGSVATVLAASGVAVNSATALKVSCLFQAVRLHAETTAGLPIKIYREEGRSKVPAKDHELWKLLRRRPNPRHTAVQFREILTAHRWLYGLGAARIKLTPDGKIESLVPLDPERIEIELLETDRLVFRYRKLNGETVTLHQEDVFRVDGVALQDVVGSSVIRLAREAIGNWMAHERFAGKFFTQGARPSLGLELPAGVKLDDKARAALKEEQAAMYSGESGWHRIFMAQGGAKIVQLGFDAKNAQMSETKESIVRDFARWGNVPEHMLRGGERPTYASAEQFGREFVDYSIKPDTKAWEGAIVRDLLIDEDEDDISAEHIFDELLRGSTKERYESYGIAVTNGIMTRNEARQRENLEPLDGLDEPLTPMNMQRGTEGSDQNATTPPPPKQRPAEPEEEDDDEATPPAPPAPAAAPAPRRLVLIAQTSAERIVRKETSALAEKATKLAGKPDAWADFVAGFYAAHAPFVAGQLQLEPAVAEAYCHRHRDQLLADGGSVLERWQTEAVRELTDLALEEIPHAA